MITAKQLLVICPNRDKCTIPSCMHYTAHKPVNGNCHLVMSECPGFLSKCQVIKEKEVKGENSGENSQ